ncbi:hypothetical protein [Delftia sp. ASV31]|uniref:hypothetical protein n=1 Tax=Delftia sp. ASV31 TaxID=2795113 RepID=UPI0018ED2B61|nr:hypothetical protein [Delftia sp. ASV31]
MLKTESLDPLFSLLEEMTLVQREDGAFQPSARMRRLESATLYGYLGAMALLVIAAWVQRAWPSQSVATSIWPLYVVVLLCALAYLLTSAFNAGHVLWRHRKQRFPGLLARIKLDIQADANFLTQLHGYDKATLEYAQLQYRHRWNIFDGRVGLLTGDLRKLGLFPALTASAMAASTLLKNDSNIYLWMPLILTACFYLVAFHAHGRRERPQQVVDLLDYAIDHAEAKAASPPEAPRTTGHTRIKAARAPRTTARPRADNRTHLQLPAGS